MSQHSPRPINPIPLTGSDLLNVRINVRTDDFIVVSKKELHLADTTTTTMSKTSEGLKLTGTTLLGYSLSNFNFLAPSSNSSPSLILLLVGIGSIVAGFCVDSRKKSIFGELLEPYKTNSSPSE